MPTEIKMPQLGESVHEGTIGRWLKRPGDAVAKYEPLVEVITDKVNVEMPSPASGVLREVLVQEGETVVVGTAIALIEEQAREAPRPAAGPAPPAAPAARPAGAPAPAPEPGSAASGAPSALPSAVPAPPAVDGAARPGRPRPEGQAARLSPLVRRLAEEHRLTPEELGAIPGSGEGGRITKDDVLTYLQHRGAAGAAPARPASAPSPPAAAEPARAPAAPGPAAAGEELHRLSPLRRAIAERMAQSKREIPHAYGTVEVDMTALVRHRAAYKAAWEAREGVNVSVTAFLVRAATRALRAFPMVNATFTPEGVLYKQAIHFGVGVAVPDGLIVPVIKYADQKGVVVLAREIAQLAARAREGRLTLDDVSGGTFTLTNPGVFGSITSMPIINYPQAAILSADAIVRRPVVLGEGIAIREIMHLGLAFDHRVFDGAVAVQFLTHIKQQLEAFAPAGDSPEL
jgi:pyruvate/2-oxoglutarate dehydrogenase complex dihydrolipoamide acyltransferase (E2) component